MADTVNIPGAGEMKKKTLLIVGGGAAVILAVYYVRHKGASQSSQATTTPDQIDPATGYAYGSPEDAQALADQSAYQNPVGYGGGGGPSTSGTTVNPIATNAEWTQAAESYLTSNGLSFSPVSSALGKYITGQPLTSSEAGIVNQAIAAVGQPPVAGANGYPPSLKMTTAATPKMKLATPSNVRIASINRAKHEAVISWAAVTHATSYTVYRDGIQVHKLTDTKVTVSHEGNFTVMAHADGYYNSSPSKVVRVVF